MRPSWKNLLGQVDEKDCVPPPLEDDEQEGAAEWQSVAQGIAVSPSRPPITAARSWRRSKKFSWGLKVLSTASLARST